MMLSGDTGGRLKASATPLLNVVQNLDVKNGRPGAQFLYAQVEKKLRGPRRQFIIELLNMLAPKGKTLSGKPVVKMADEVGHTPPEELVYRLGGADQQARTIAVRIAA